VLTTQLYPAASPASPGQVSLLRHSGVGRHQEYCCAMVPGTQLLR